MMMLLWLSQVALRRSVDGALLERFQVQPPCNARSELAMDRFGGGSADASDTCSKIIAKVEQSIRLYHDTLRQADVRAQQRLEELALNPLFHISSSDADDWGYSDSSDEESVMSIN